MKRLLYASTSLILINFFLSANVFAQKGVVKQVKLVNFDLQSSALVKDAGADISSPTYHSAVYWMPVKVPSTVLTGLVGQSYLS